MNRIIAFYLPQYYEFPENNMWWGDGFTEWTNVKKSKPLYKGHYQPTIPLNNNFYSLDNIDTMKWQADLAKKYNIYGFCFYHYWFGEERQLMEKPVDAWLEHKEIEYPYCLCWANHNWSRTWTGGDKEILMDMKYGEIDEWEKHFCYLLPFFKDKRYIKHDGKPILLIYLPQDISCLKEMHSYFQKRAKEEGFDGLQIIAQNCFNDVDFDKIKEIVPYRIKYQPNYSHYVSGLKKHQTFKISKSYFEDKCKYLIKTKIKEITKGMLCKYKAYSYDAIWDYIVNDDNIDSTWFAGAFVRCDVTPRRQDRAIIYEGDTPEKFKSYLTRLLRKVNTEYSNHIVFLSAWNEWGEGMYLEPDEKTKYEYLNAVREALNEANNDK